MSARFPLFKGATRVPTVAGVPLVPLVVLVVAAASAGVIFGVGWLALLVPGWLLMVQITKTDDRAFRVLWLWMQTKLANRLRMARFWGRTEFWGASTYSLSDGRLRSSEREGGRWRG
jgi:type IV secretion system protein VirB3